MRYKVAYRLLLAAFFVSCLIIWKGEVIALLLKGYGINLALQGFDPNVSDEMLRKYSHAYDDAFPLMHYMTAASVIIWVITFLASAGVVIARIRRRVIIVSYKLDIVALVASFVLLMAVFLLVVLPVWIYGKDTLLRGGLPF